MAPIWQTIFSNIYSRMKSFLFSLKYILFVININSSLVEIMAWRLFGVKTLSQPMRA